MNYIQLQYNRIRAIFKLIKLAYILSGKILDNIERLEKTQEFKKVLSLLDIEVNNE